MKLLVALFALLTAVCPAHAVEPFVRAVVESEGAIVPGQQVHVSVSVFVPDFFTSPPQFPLFDIADAVVTLSDERAQNQGETIDGVRYSGIRRYYLIVPQVAGTFALPAQAITFGYSVDGRPTLGSASISPVTFQVGSTSGTGTPSVPFAARKLSINQTFDRDPSKLEAGEAVVRTITVYAEDTQAMMIPSPLLGDTPGLKQYAEPPVIRDGVKEGRSTGSTHVETVTYTTEDPGIFTLPAVAYAWFDLDAHRQEMATLPATTISAAAAMANADRIAPPDDAVPSPNHPALAAGWEKAVVFLLAILVISFFVYRTFPRRARVSYLHHDPHRMAFRSLKEAVRAGDRMSIYNELRSWATQEGFKSLGAWTEARGLAEISAQVTYLERELFGKTSGPAFEKERMLAALTATLPIPSAHTANSALPALNPA